MQHTTPASFSLEFVSADLLELVQGGCHKRRPCCSPQFGAGGYPAVSGSMAGPGSGGPIFQQIMQLPSQLFQGLQGYGQQSMGYDPSQFAATSQPQRSGGEVQTSVQVGQQ